MRRIALASVFAVALASLAPDARANGRFPESNAIFFADPDPNLVILRVTFGSFISRDRGKTWAWLCEKSLGTAGVEDPMYTLTPNATWVASTYLGVTISHDQACTFGYAPGDMTGLVFVDLAANPADKKNIVAFASAYDHQDDAGNILFKSNLFETKDEAVSFADLGLPLDPSLSGYTVDLAKTDPMRIYVSAVQSPGVSPQGFLLTSKDHGVSWTPHPIPFVASERAIYIAGVDPTNAERVYLRTFDATDKPSRLILSDDGGDTFKTVFTAKSALAGFALTADGSKIYIGGLLDGVQVANTTDFAFQQRSTLQVQCLALGTDGVWACSNEASGFVAGLSTDDGVTFTSKLHFCDVTGPLACPAGTPTNVQCSAAWPTQRALLGCSGDNDGGTTDGGVVDGGNPAAPLPNGGSSCSCRTTPASPFGALVASIGALVAFVRRRKRPR